MAGSAVRRPLPALIALVALLILTGLVWWRVIDRDDTTRTSAHKQACGASGSPTSSGSPASSGSPTGSPSASPTVSLPAPSAVSVYVLNSTDRNGIAGRARSALLKAGFQSPQAAANFTGRAKITGVGEIRFPARSRNAARLVGYYLPGAKLVAVSSPTPTVTVVLGPRYRAVLTTAQADRALAAHRAKTSATPTPRATKTC